MNGKRRTHVFLHPLFSKNFTLNSSVDIKGLKKMFGEINMFLQVKQNENRTLNTSHTNQETTTKRQAPKHTNAKLRRCQKVGTLL